MVATVNLVASLIPKIVFDHSLDSAPFSIDTLTIIADHLPALPSRPLDPVGCIDFVTSQLLELSLIILKSRDNITKLQQIDSLYISLSHLLRQLQMHLSDDIRSNFVSGKSSTFAEFIKELQNTVTDAKNVENLDAGVRLLLDVRSFSPQMAAGDFILPLLPPLLSTVSHW